MLQQETRNLTEKFAKAHNVDPEKWFLDSTGAFRPVAVPSPPAKK